MPTEQERLEATIKRMRKVLTAGRKTSLKKPPGGTKKKVPILL